MANEEHLRILKQDVEAWNRWRRERSDIAPDLSEANLFDADLSWVNLSGANLSNANLVRADLTNSDLSNVYLRGAHIGGADLCAADLRGADLSAADLGGADFSAANLCQADFSEANLGWARFSEGYLAEADLSEAIVGWTTFGDVDLSDVKGLDKVKHRGPSTVGIDTIYRSKGRIPEVFLRGCGVPDEIIAIAKSLAGQLIQFYSCFISYSSKNQEFAERLHADLQIRGVRCWFAPHDLKIGDEIRPRIDEAIWRHDKLLLILSEDSIDSEWVKDEVEEAYEKERQQKRTVLFPVRLDEAVMNTGQAWAAKLRRERHIGDFRGWKDHDAYRDVFERLMRDLQSEK
jgi:hypothetical protein